jgi:hypothetical protein
LKKSQVKVRIAFSNPTDKPMNSYDIVFNQEYNKIIILSFNLK